MFLGLTGYEYQVCDPYCGHSAETWPNGMPTVVKFSSPFHKAPSIIISMQRFGKLNCETSLKLHFTKAIT